MVSHSPPRVYISDAARTPNRRSPLRLAAKSAILALALTSATAFGAPAKPCYKHTANEKPKCVAAYKARVRANDPYPPHPTWAEFKARATDYEYATLRRIGVCEEGGSGSGEPWNIRWGFQGSTYSSAFGIWNGNFAYTRSVTGYSWPTSNKAEEAMHALSLARRYGFSAWGCF